MDIQATTNSVKTKQTRDRVDSVQAAAREDRRTVTDLRNQLERLTEKMTDMEDRSRRNNVRLVGLPEGAEGSDVAGFLRVNLSKWIPSLKGRNIEIDRAHRVYDGRKNSDRPRTLIFRVLRWHDRLEILIPLFHQGSSSAGTEPEPSFKSVLCLSTPKAPAPNQQKRFVSSTKTLLG